MKKVTIRPARKYEVLIDGESIGEFTKTSEWNGMVEMKEGTTYIIVSMPDRRFTDMLNAMMGTVEESCEAVVVKASPSIAAMLI